MKKFIKVAALSFAALIVAVFALNAVLIAVGYEPETPVEKTEETTHTHEEETTTTVKLNHYTECKALENTVKVAKENKKYWFAEERRLYANETYDCGL